MQSIKDLIARRRPSMSDGVVPEAFEEPGAEVERLQDQELPEPRPILEDSTHFKAEMKQSIDSDAPATERTDFLAKAVDARDHVPTAVAPPKIGYRVMSSARKSVSVDEVSAPPEPIPTHPRKIWDLDPPVSPAKPISGGHDKEPPARNGQSQSNASRAKTRLLGFHGTTPVEDVFSGKTELTAAQTNAYPIGWLVLVDGPGRGASFTLSAGLSTVGRDPDQSVSLDFGDAAISRSQHVAIAYDSEENRTFIGHGGKQNIVRLNGKPLLTTEVLNDRDEIRIGKSTLRFISLCDASFSWDGAEGVADERA